MQTEGYYLDLKTFSLAKFKNALKTAQLLFRADVDPELYHDHAKIDQLTLELVDLAVGALPLRFVAESLDPLDHHPAVPTAVKDQ